MSIRTKPRRSAEEGSAIRLQRARRSGIVVVAVALAAMMMPVGQAAADVTFNQRMLQLVNDERTANGLAPLVVEPTLAATAEDAPYDGCGFTVLGRAKDMGERNYFSHTILGCAVQSVFNILASTGLVYSGGGENVAWMNGTTDPMVAAQNLHSQLMNSSGHRANILNPTFTKVGIGSWRTGSGQTWSGGGFALTNVFIGVEVFAGGPVDPVVTTTTAPPTTTTPPPPSSTTGGKYHPLTPSRILDTRNGTGARAGQLGTGTMNVQVTGRGGVPSTGVSAVVLNVGVTEPSAASFLTAFPTGEAFPGTANLNWVAGQTVSNMVTAKVGSNGQIALLNGAGSTHVIADVAGWYGV
ncbi:MAG: CAP domain-containing protein [Acidimicrobiales bacterium]